MATIAIFGGSFDPIHRGHLGIAREVIKHQLADEIMFLPAAQAPHKVGKTQAPAKVRLEMLNACMERGFSVCTFEMDRSGVTSFSVDSMRALSFAFEGHKLKFLMGMDSLLTIHTWREPAAFIRNNEFIIYGRPHENIPTEATLIENLRSVAGSETPTLVKKLLKAVVQFELFDISSTQIRQAVASKQSLEGLVPEAVAEIIQKRNLYGV